MLVMLVAVLYFVAIPRFVVVCHFVAGLLYIGTDRLVRRHFALLKSRIKEEISSVHVLVPGQEVSKRL